MPKKLAGTIPKVPHLLVFRFANILCILDFANTDIAEPIKMPIIQYLII